MARLPDLTLRRRTDFTNDIANTPCVSVPTYSTPPRAASVCTKDGSGASVSHAAPPTLRNTFARVGTTPTSSTAR